MTKSILALNEFFNLEELVPPETIRAYGISATWFVNKTHFDSITWLRKRMDIRFRINNYLTGGPQRYRGYRPPSYKGGSTESQHRCANATDFDSQDMLVGEIYKWIMDNQEEIVVKTSIRRIESLALTNKSGDGWIHLDSAWCPNAKGILVIGQ